MPQVDKFKNTGKSVVQESDSKKAGLPTENHPIGGERHPGEVDQVQPKSDDFKRRSESAKRA